MNDQSTAFAQISQKFFVVASRWRQIPYAAMPSLGVGLTSSELLLARPGGTALRNTSSRRRGDSRNRRAAGWPKRGRRGELTGSPGRED